MEALSAMLAEHGLWVVFFTVLVEQLGAPIPALPVLALAGALARDGLLSAPAALAVALLASTLGDAAWYQAGRRHGHRVLGLLCRVSLSPDTCVRQTESAFERYGAWSLVLAKFAPGLSTLAPPLAGALGVAPRRFLLLNGAGVLLWAGAGLAAGYLFHGAVDWLLAQLALLGRWAAALIGLALAAYALRRWQARRRARAFLQAARISVDELRAMLDAGHAPVVLDVRSGASRLVEAGRIPGALALAPAEVAQAAADLPRDREVIVYCNCPGEASAVQVGMQLHRLGFDRVRALQGGLDAWVAAGHALEFETPAVALGGEEA